MKSFSKTSMLITIALVFMTTIVVAVFSLGIFQGRGKPSDEQLKAAFIENRASFMELQRFLAEDSTLFYVSEFELIGRDEQGAIAKSQTTDEYISVFRRIRSFSDGIKAETGGLTYWAFSIYSMLLDNSDPNETFSDEKGYALMVEPEEKIQRLLGTNEAYGNVKFKQIEGRWYIYERVVVSKPE